MATDVNVLKKKKKKAHKLGAPPTEARVQPVAPPPVDKFGEDDPGLADMRLYRRSPRTIAFATKVRPSVARRIQQICLAEGIPIVELLERMVAAYPAGGETEG